MTVTDRLLPVLVLAVLLVGCPSAVEPYGAFQGTKCVPVVEPAAAVGEACEGPDEDGGDNCEKGAVCWGGKCVALCIGSPDVCAPGLVCHEDVSPTCPGSCCTPICDLMGAAVCPEPDQVCVPYYTPGAAPPGYEAVGYCGIPM